MAARGRLPGSVLIGAPAAGTPTTLAAVALLLAALLTLPLAACQRGKLLPRSDGAAVVMMGAADAGAEPGVTGVVEIEPNGALNSAQRLDLAVSSAQSVSGSIATGAEPGAAGQGQGQGKGKGRDVDIYRVLVPPDPTTAAASPDAARLDALAPGGPGAPASASARPTNRRRLSALVRPDLGLPIAVEALDDAGQPLVAASGGQPGEVEGVPSLTVTPGTYFIKVRAAQPGAEGGYRLTVRLLPVEAGEEVEPNGKATLAGPLSPSGEVVGYLGWRKDQDWYRVPLDGLADGSVLSADLEAVPGVTASLLVFDSVERKLMEVHGRREERVALRNIRLNPGEPFLYLQARADSGRNVDVRYNLRVRTEVAKAGAAGGDSEPNDDAAHANPLADGTVQGYLGRGDVDVYRYVAAEPLELDIEAAPPERVDLKLEVVRELDGLLLVRADAGKRQEPERLPNLFAPAGALLIRLSASKGDGNPDDPYRLTVASHRPEPGAEREPNGSAASATPLGAGASGNGLLFPRGDVDFWQAPAAPDGEGNVAVTVTGIAGLALDVRVSTTAPDREVGRFKISGDAPVTNRLTVGAAACCLLQVREATGKAANFRDRYTVSVGR